MIHFFLILFKGDFVIETCRINNANRSYTYLLTRLPASASYNSSLDTSADIAFLVSLDDGTVIFDKNADKKAAPASLTKIVTAILTIENCADLDTVITIKQSSLDLLKGTDSSTAGLKADEEISIKICCTVCS